MDLYMMSKCFERNEAWSDAFTFSLLTANCDCFEPANIPLKHFFFFFRFCFSDSGYITLTHIYKMKTAAMEALGGEREREGRREREERFAHTLYLILKNLSRRC